jgi:hypothetical protein
VQGTLPGVTGATIDRVMTVAQRSDGDVVVHSAIACDEPTMSAIRAIGPIRYLLVPGPSHRIDAPAYKESFAGIRVFTPRGAVEKVTAKVPVDGTYDEFPSDPMVWLDTVAGMGDADGAMWVRSQDGLTLVLNDCMFDTDEPENRGVRALSHVLGTAPGPRVPRVIRWKFVTDARALAADLRRYAEMPGLTRLIVSHDRLESGAAAANALRTAADTLDQG